MSDLDSAAERRRTTDPAWRRFGPYLPARQWGTVREDYSADGNAWDYFPFEQARARAYRWGEDALAGFSDQKQLLCFGLALWNGQDEILKERPFGLTNEQGNHGEDVKDYWWIVDDTPTHSWAQSCYRYPQAAFPYADLIHTNAGRSRDDREYRLSDTGILDGQRFFDVTVSYAKADHDDICIDITAVNHGPDTAPLHILPTAWFRNTWAWDAAHSDKPSIELIPQAGGPAIRCTHSELGSHVLAADGDPTVLFTDNETNAVALFGADRNPSAYTKDGIDNHVVHGLPTIDERGPHTKAAFWYRFDAVPAGGEVSVRLRLSASGAAADPDVDAVLTARRAEADGYYRGVLGDAVDTPAGTVARRAFAGLLWSTKAYRFDVARWLDGDPAQPTPPAERRGARNSRWRHVDVASPMSLPDEWEYPWPAAWDLAFHTIALAHVDPELAKDQLILLGREWLRHPDGQLPAYEWDFGDVNPPVHAWAALRVFRIDAAITGTPDRDFLARIFHKQLMTFTWWVNRKDADGSNLFEGGFLGMDNIGVFNRSAPPAGWRLEQSDATSWMAIFCLSMLEIALELARADHVYGDAASTFFEHFCSIANASTSFGSDGGGIWDEHDGFCYDVLSRVGAGGDLQTVPVAIRSMTGLLPIAAVAPIPGWALRDLPGFAGRVDWMIRHRPELVTPFLGEPDADGDRLLSLLQPGQLSRMLDRMLDEAEFLSPHGLRSLSAAYRDGGWIDLDGDRLTIDYEPGESTVPMFGGNSNWRGPIWFPVNSLLIDALRRRHTDSADAVLAEVPTGSDRLLNLGEVAADLEDRLIALFLPGGDGRAPGTPRDFGAGPLWDPHPTFSEYFHGDTGEGLGATHQTGWTALVAAMIAERANEPAPPETLAG